MKREEKRSDLASRYSQSPEDGLMVSRLCCAIARRARLESRHDERWGFRYIERPDKLARRVAFWVEAGRKLRVSLWPADTVGQARHFYASVERTAFLSLKHWQVDANLHFSIMGTHLVWAKTALETREYFDHFSDESSYGGNVDRATLSFWAGRWERDGIISTSDREEITNLSQQRINVIPGFEVSREWSLDEWEPRGSGALQADIVDALASPLATWGETL